MNAVERETVETRVLNPTASEASYKPKQRSYRTTNLKKKVLAPNSSGAEMYGAEMSSAETAVPNRRRRNVPDPSLYIIATSLALNIMQLLKENTEAKPQLIMMMMIVPNSHAR